MIKMECSHNVHKKNKKKLSESILKECFQNWEWFQEHIVHRCVVSFHFSCFGSKSGHSGPLKPEAIGSHILNLYMHVFI